MPREEEAAEDDQVGELWIAARRPREGDGGDPGEGEQQQPRPLIAEAPAEQTEDLRRVAEGLRTLGDRRRDLRRGVRRGVGKAKEGQAREDACAEAGVVARPAGAEPARCARPAATAAPAGRARATGRERLRDLGEDFPVDDFPRPVPLAAGAAEAVVAEGQAEL
jgi:hypothetical protein